MSIQRPTLQNIRIRSVRDALHIFYAVAAKRLPLITRRLDAEERRAICSGNVYVWEERGANTEPTGLGMERWTDGMGWGPSRVRDEFLFYNQKDTNFGEDLVNPITPWAQMMRKREQPTIPVSVYMANQPERLVKQTYSVHVTLPSDSPRGIVRKWHLTAYFSQQRLDDLGTIDNIRGVGDVPVPEGLFKSARAGKMRRDNRNSVKKAVSPSEGPYLPEASGFQSDYCDTASRNSQYYGCPSFPSLFPHPTTSSRFSDNSRDSSPSSDSSRLGPSQHASLVPLEYLQNISAPRRNPADEQQLRRFSSQTTGPSG